MNNKYFLPNFTLYHLHQLGFHYSISDESYVLTFPIIRYKGRPTLLCKVYYDKLDNKIMYDIIKPNNERLAIYYNREFGDSQDYIKKIDSIVSRKMRAMGFKKKKEHINKYKKEIRD